jgi:hypothetical protein
MLSLALFAFVACVVDTANEDRVDERQESDLEIEPIKTVSFVSDSGDEVDVYRLEDDTVIVSAIAKEDSEYVPLIEDYQKRNIDLVALYRAITDDPDIPNDIEEMNELLKTNEQKESFSDEEQQDEVGPEPPEDIYGNDSDKDTHKTYVWGNSMGRRTMSDADFQELCDMWNTGDINRCLIRRTGNYYYAAWMSYFDSHLYVYRGSAKHKLRRKVAGNYSGLISRTVQAGYLSYYSGVCHGIRDYLKMEVNEGEGDGWHFRLAFGRW